MSDYVPTTEQVRERYILPAHRINHEERGEEFDRWLAAEIAAAEKRGWDECVNEAGDLGLIHDIGVREMLARNPHRADRIEEGT